MQDDDYIIEVSLTFLIGIGYNIAFRKKNVLLFQFSPAVKLVAYLYFLASQLTKVEKDSYAVIVSS